MKRVICFGIFVFVLAMSSIAAFANDKIEKLITLAQQGDAQAQYGLASKYENGNGVKQNTDLALKWYWKAAENGNVGAQVDLGWFYQNGQFVKKDIEKAVAFYLDSVQKTIELKEELIAWDALSDEALKFSEQTNFKRK